MMSGIAGDPSESESEPARGPPPATHGPLCLVVVVAAVAGQWSCLEQACGDVELPLSWALQGSGLAVGLALVSAWVFAETSAEPSCAGVRLMRAQALKTARWAQHFYGYIENPVKEVMTLDSPLPVLGRTAGQLVKAMSDATAALLRPLGSASPQPCSVRRILREWQASELERAMWTASPKVAYSVLCGRWSALNVVACTGKVNRKNLLMHGLPKQRELKLLAAHARRNQSSLALPQEQLVPIRVPAWAKQMLNVEVMVDWLEASSYLKDVRKNDEAACAYAKVLSRSVPGVTDADLTDGVEKPHHDALRLARVRLDWVCMQLGRQLFLQSLQAAGHNQCNIFLFADASPQWRGVEVFCASYDLMVSNVFQRRMLPIVGLNYDFLGVIGKTQSP